MNKIYFTLILCGLFTLEISNTYALRLPFSSRKYERSQKSTKNDTDPDMIYLEKNELSPNYPVQVVFPEQQEEGVDVTHLNADYLLSLNEIEREKFIHDLAQIKVSLEWKDNTGNIESIGVKKNKTRNHRKRINAASALVLELMSEKKSDLASIVMAQSGPRTALEFTNERFCIIFDPEFTAKTLLNIIHDINEDNIIEHIRTATTTVFTYIRYWSKGVPQKHLRALNSLIEKIHIFQEKERMSVKQKGILLGSVLSGTLNYSNGIKKKDEKRIYIINSITNLIWASTTLLGALPVGGNIIALVGGGISIGVVAYDVFYNGIGVRDYSPGIREIEGVIEIKVLENVENSDFEQKTDALMLLKWMQATIHLDGSND